MRVLICGDRNWTDIRAIARELEALPKNSTIIEGEARGADSIAASEASKRGFLIRRFPANWEQYGRAAGSIRNKQMLIEGKPNLVLAFHSNIAQSKGTKDRLRQARNAGIQCRLLTG